MQIPREVEQIHTFWCLLWLEWEIAGSEWLGFEETVVTNTAASPVGEEQCSSLTEIILYQGIKVSVGSGFL